MKMRRSSSRWRAMGGWRAAAEATSRSRRAGARSRPARTGRRPSAPSARSTRSSSSGRGSETASTPRSAPPPPSSAPLLPLPLRLPLCRLRSPRPPPFYHRSPLSPFHQQATFRLPSERARARLLHLLLHHHLLVVVVYRHKCHCIPRIFSRIFLFPAKPRPRQQWHTPVKELQTAEVCSPASTFHPPPLRPSACCCSSSSHAPLEAHKNASAEPPSLRPKTEKK